MHLSSTSLQALLHGFKQSNRLLQLTTPLGPDALIAECVHGEEAIDAPFVFRVSVLTPDANIALKSLLGQPALLQLLTAQEGARWRPFHGYIAAVDLTGANGGLARYALTLKPWTSFLALGRDSRTFHDATVFNILETVFSAYRGKGRLAPKWRFDIADGAAYPVRSLTTQYQESDLCFVERLLWDEGLFYYFEHHGDPDSATLGEHTLVVADHNGSFAPNAQPRIRFTQSSAVMKEDAIDRWRTELRLQSNAVKLSSWDYRTGSSRPVASAAPPGPDGGPTLASSDTLGAYAYGTRAHGQQMAVRHLQGLEVRKEIHVGAGTVRTMAPATRFVLNEQAHTDVTDSDDERSFVALRVVHLMHNNLSAELRAEVGALLAPGALAEQVEQESAASLHATGRDKGERPLYRMRTDAIRAHVPYRPYPLDEDGAPRRWRARVSGQQTALVVGPAGSVVHTDRDHRIKVQFHWQRGSDAHSRLSHPAPDGHTGAPADDTAGTWVRLSTAMAPVAGANWGSNAIPRVGQEVLVDFIDGDIERPVVIGAVFNGKGQADAQHNAVSHGAGASTGNAPPWFPGESGAHGHPAVLSGFKSQGMASSPSGAGQYSQLVLDDSAAQARISLQRHARAHDGTDELNLGRLLDQCDNARHKPTGFGAELATKSSAALRAGGGMLLSSDARLHGAGAALAAGEAQAQIEQSAGLQRSLTDTAVKHNAGLKDLDGQPQAASDRLPAIAALAESADIIGASAGGSVLDAHSGGHGTATVFGQPQMQLSSPAGIAATTPHNAIISARAHSSVAAQDINFAAQGNAFHSVAAGISLFTYGKAVSSNKPNQETGLALHAASGKLSSQSQGGATLITADKAVTVASIGKQVKVAAKDHVLMTAQGAFLRIEGGNIMLHGPGTIAFKATMKELAGPQQTQPEKITFPTSILNTKLSKGYPFSR